MNHLNNIVRANVLEAVAGQSGRRAMRAPESEKQFWMNRNAALLCAAKLPQRGADVIRRLNKLQPTNPKFTELCQNLNPSP